MSIPMLTHVVSKTEAMDIRQDERVPGQGLLRVTGPGLRFGEHDGVVDDGVNEAHLLQEAL